MILNFLYNIIIIVVRNNRFFFYLRKNYDAHVFRSDLISLFSETLSLFGRA